MPRKIFISYSRKDKNYADKLSEDLQGFPVFLDQKNLYSGDKWWERIIQEIQDCQLFLFVDTQESNRSIFCKAELQWAHDLNRNIIPVVPPNSQKSSLAILTTCQYHEYNLIGADRQNNLLIQIGNADTREYPDPLPDPPKCPDEDIQKFINDVDKEMEDHIDFHQQFFLVEKIKNRFENSSSEVQERYKELVVRASKLEYLGQKYASELTDLITRFDAEFVPHQYSTDPFSYIHEYAKLLATEIREGRSIPFLGPGLTPELYFPKLESTIADLIGKLIFKQSWPCSEHPEQIIPLQKRRELVNAVIGLPCSACHFFVTQRPIGSADANEEQDINIPKGCPMIESLPLTDPMLTEQQLAIAINNLRYLSDYYLLCEKQKSACFDSIRNHIRELFGSPGNYDKYGVYKFFKDLPNDLSKGRMNTQVFDIWLTTNFIDSTGFCMDPDIVFTYEAQWIHDAKYEIVLRNTPEKFEPSETPWSFDIKTGKFNTKNGNNKRYALVLNLCGNASSNYVHSSPILSKTQFNKLLNSFYLMHNDIFSALHSTSRSLFLIGFSPNDLEVQQIVQQLSFKGTDYFNIKIFFVYQETAIHTIAGDPTRLSVWAWQNISKEVYLLPVPSLTEFMKYLRNLVLESSN